MQTLIRIFGYPHEWLHALALRLIGRRAVAITQTHIDIPDDLTTGQFVFVAGLPALVFWGIAGIAALSLFGAASVLQAALSLLVMFVMGTGAAATLGDLHLIITRLQDEGRRGDE